MNPSILQMISKMPLTREQVMSQINAACDGTSIVTDEEIGLLDPTSEPADHVRFYLRAQPVLATRILALREIWIALCAAEETERDHQGTRYTPHCVIDDSSASVIWVGVAQHESCALDQFYFEYGSDCPGTTWRDLVGREISPTAGQDWTRWDPSTPACVFEPHLIATQEHEAQRDARWFTVRDHSDPSPAGAGGKIVLVTKTDRPEVAIAEYMCNHGGNSKFLIATEEGEG